MKKKLLLLAGAFAYTVSASAAIISIVGSTNTTGQNNGGDFADWTGLPVVTTAPGTTMPTSAVNDGLATLSLIDSGAAFVSQTWASGTVYSVGAEANFSAGTPIANLDSTSALTNNAFLEINLSTLAFASTAVDINSISVSLWRNGAGAAGNYQFAFAADGNYDATDFLGAPTFVDAGIVNAGTISYTGAPIVSDVTNASIRLYYWGNTNINGNTHLYNVTADYAVVVPEPSVYALVASIGVLGVCLVRRRKS